MSGILKYVAAGAVGGLGRGMAQVGEAEQRAAEAELARRERAADQEREIRLRSELGGGRLGRGSGGGGGGGGGGVDTSKMDRPGLARLFREQGMLPDRANDAAGLVGEGVLPMADVAVADESGGHSQRVAKYQPGEAAKLAEDARIALRRAVAAPGQTDDVAKAEQTEVVSGALRKYGETGDARSGEVVALGTKGVINNEDGNVVTGRVAPGSTAEAKRNRDNATAGKESALAAKAKQEKETGVKDADVTRANNAVAAVYDRKGYNARIKAIEGDATLTPADRNSRIAALQAEAEKDPDVVRARTEADNITRRRDEGKGGKDAKSYPDAPRDPAQRKSGTVYMTPKGPLKWMGTGWSKV